MCDPAFNDPWSSDDLTWRGQGEHVIDCRMAEMRQELGCREAPAFERLRNYLHVPSDIPARVVAEVVEMFRARCFADSQSFRQSREAALWAELHWLPEEKLIEAFTEMWRPQYYPPWKSSTLVKHSKARSALWTQVLSRRVDVETVLDINAEANMRGDHAFLQKFESLLATLNIVASAK